MADRGWQARLRGETPKQHRRRENADAHPVWMAVASGTFFGVCMGLYDLAMGASPLGAAIYGLTLGAIFGPALTFFLRRQHR
jgi:F0F1-type ATP synthase assembly protein I